MGVAAGEMQNDAAHGEDHPRGDLEELESNGGDLSTLQFGAGESDTSQVFDEHVGGGGQQQPELIGQELVTTGAVGKEPELLFLDAILHLAARGVPSVVDSLRPILEIGHHEARVGPLPKMFGFDDDATFVLPGLGGVAHFVEAALLALEEILLSSLPAQLERLHRSLETTGVGAEANIADKWGLLSAYNLSGPVVAAYTDGFLYGKIRVGGPIMPPWGHQITHFDRWNIVNYVRQLQSEAGSPRTGTQHCYNGWFSQFTRYPELPGFPQK